MKNKYRIYNKSCLNMKQVKTNSVKLVFTSPPYWNLKDYGTQEQSGYKQSYIDYLNDMNCVWTESFRVLKDEGVIVININSRIVNGTYYPIHLDFHNQLQKIGFKHFKMAFWHKASGVPTQSNKLTDRFEYLIIAGKNKIIKNKYDYNDYKNSELLNINSWHIIKKAGSILSKHPHPAFFPVGLAERGILKYTKENDLVLDPFLGSGSTMFASYNLNRECIGYEISKDYIKTSMTIKPNGLDIEII